MSKNYIQTDPKDNIIIAITFLQNGFKMGNEIYMYGVLIGKATQAIQEGCAITINNVSHA